MRKIPNLWDIIDKKAIITAEGETFRGIVIDGTITLNVGDRQVCIPFGVVRELKVIE